MHANLDLIAVEAIKNGDMERYQELVERYEQQVYAVAWSRLGDADLAQEATQEAFIKGYQHLAFLNHGGKFSAWIMAITRNLAVNLGLKRRNELKKRKRWALEQAERVQSPPLEGTAEEEPVSPDMLRTILADLSPKHRECLVMFYLEGKSIAEAAQVAGLSGNAFKTRLFRARGALRKRMESRLDTSLARLRPRHAIAPIVMGLLTTQKVQAACSLGASKGALTKAGVSITKLLPFKLLMAGPMLTGFVTGLLFQYKIGRWELKNFRDQEGFRAQNYQRSLTKALFLAPLRIIFCLFLIGVAFSAFGKRGAFLFFGLYCLYYVFSGLRQLRVNPSRFIVYHLCGFLVFAITYLAEGFFKPIIDVFPYGMAGALLFFGLAHRHRPHRMDYSLFLRLIKDLIPANASVDPKTRLPVDDIWAFARFLGERWLVINAHQKKEGLQLRLACARPSLWYEGFSPFAWMDCSSLTVGFDACIQAKLGLRDHAALTRLQPALAIEKEALESGVERAVSCALQAFLESDTVEAERLLGQEPEEEIFHVNPKQSNAVRWRERVMIGLSVLMLVLAAVSLWEDRYRDPIQGRRLKAVHVSENQVRTVLAQLDTPPPPKQESQDWNARESEFTNATGIVAIPREQETPCWTAFEWALSSECRVLPPPDWFSPPARDNIRQHIQNMLVPRTRRTDISRCDQIMDQLFMIQWKATLTATQNGVIGQSDLMALGLTPDAVRQYLTGRFARIGIPRTYIQGIVVNDIRQDYAVLNAEELAAHMELLSVFDCMDLVDAEPIAKLLQCHQVIAGNSLGGRKPISDRGLVHGLFHCMSSNPLRGTYSALTVLSELKGLDRIDRDACIRGILRFHHGKGLFSSFKKNDGLYFTGNARDTFYAYESLRLLDGLDQVKDLHKWVFRPDHTSKISTQHPIRRITWSEIEAWIMTQGLKKFIADRRQNPKLEAPSLLDRY
jgi:RNA polymerase sigma-70 factor, ECF subfamily